MACGIFLKPTHRVAINNTFDGSETAAYVARYSPRMLPTWEFTMKFERSVRMMAVIVGASGMWSAQAEIKRGYAKRPTVG